jgi:hypothetical protein
VKKYLSRTGRAAVVALLCVGAYASVAAIEKRAIPSFSLTRLDGTTVDSAQLTTETQYLLLYVRPDCRPCDRLLALVKSANSPQLASRVVVVVNGDAAAGARYVARQIPANANALTWYADGDGGGYRALRLTGMPALIGVKDGQMMWSIAGVLNDAETVESVVRTWVTY